MATVGMSSEVGRSLGSTFASAAAGVAALDTPQLAHTKAEIRTLVSEIAELTSADIDRDEFMRGMLSRVCMAMGASAAAVWTIDIEQTVELAASQNLPEELSTASAAASESHKRVLACVAAEGEPVLVPPGSIRIEAERPVNPIDEALLIVPIRIHERVDTLLEVIQPGGGGPAAQRGYLRFVAQMADLLADYLRREKLRLLAVEAQYVKQLQRQLLHISAATSTQLRCQAIATSTARLLRADVALLVKKTSRRWRVQAISELQTFDQRSQSVATVEGMLACIEREAGTAALSGVELLEASIGSASQKLSSVRTVPSSETEHSDSALTTVSKPADSSQNDVFDRDSVRSLVTLAREQLGCEHLMRMELAADGHWQIVLGTDGASDRSEMLLRGAELAPAMSGLLNSGSAGSNWTNWLSTSHRNSKAKLQPNWKSRVERWIVRSSAIGLVLAIALFPTPDQVAVVAVLEAEKKQMYYAPMSAIVERVLVDSGQSVKVGDVLLELSDKQLEAQLNEVAGQRLTADTQLAQDMAMIKRGQQPPQQQDELESRTVQSRITIAALDEQLAILQAQRAQLKIVARDDSVVTTWDARNRLEGRPVVAGQLLLATCAPQADWRLRLSIDQRNAGMVQDALDKSPQGLPVQFSLSSHPSDVRTGRLVGLSEQLISDQDGSGKVLGTVLVDAATLPAKTDGAVARAAIDCGRVTATWFVIRDAYREASAWLRMTW